MYSQASPLLLLLNVKHHPHSHPVSVYSCFKSKVADSNLDDCDLDDSDHEEKRESFVKVSLSPDQVCGCHLDVTEIKLWKAGSEGYHATTCHFLS